MAQWPSTGRSVLRLRHRAARGGRRVRRRVPLRRRCRETADQRRSGHRHEEQVRTHGPGADRGGRADAVLRGGDPAGGRPTTRAAPGRRPAPPSRRRGRGRAAPPRRPRRAPHRVPRAHPPSPPRRRPSRPGVRTTIESTRSTTKADATTTGATGPPTTRRLAQSRSACSAAYPSLPASIRPQPSRTSRAESRAEPGGPLAVALRRGGDGADPAGGPVGPPPARRSTRSSRATRATASTVTTSRAAPTAADGRDRSRRCRSSRARTSTGRAPEARA